MITGFNTDVEYNGRIYHIQTEDRGESNPVIESLIYVGGEILAARKTPYAELLQAGLNEEALAEKVEAQHRRMILDVRQGKHDPEGVKAFGAGIITDRGFEEVVLEYLTQELATEEFQLAIDSPGEFREGLSVDLKVRVRGELSGRPLSEIKVIIELVTTGGKPRQLTQGKTDEAGEMKSFLKIPILEGEGVLLFRARHGERAVEEKRPILKSLPKE